METASTTTAQNLPPQPPPSSAPLPSRSITKKRTFDSIADLENSPYYKMRATVRDLRPHILEVSLLNSVEETKDVIQFDLGFTAVV